jgi:hypothetical protein
MRPKARWRAMHTVMSTISAVDQCCCRRVKRSASMWSWSVAKRSAYSTATRSASLSSGVVRHSPATAA